MKATRTVFLCFMLVAVVFGMQNAFAQHLMNDASGFISNSGTIRWCNDNARFINTQATITNIVNTGIFESTGANFQFTAGTIATTALGSSVAMRVPGQTRYSSAGTVQTVHARYYENLSVSQASIKTIPDGVYVGSANAGNGFYHATGGARSYLGNFYYDGTVAQNVWAGETYNGLNFQNAGPKTLTSGTTTLITNVAGAFTQEASATGTQRILGIMNLGASTSTLQAGSGNFVVGDGTASNGAGNPGTLRVGNADFIMANNSANSQGLVMTTSATGRLVVGTNNTFSLSALGGGGTAGTVRLGANHTMVVTGTFQNNEPVGTRTNMLYDPTSTVWYNGVAANQVIVPTIDMGVGNTPYYYGNLRLDGGIKLATAGNVIVAAGDISVTGSTLNLTTNNITLVATNANALVAFGSTVETGNTDNSEIIGRFLRTTTTGGKRYVYNNRLTSTQFTSGTNPSSMTITMIPGQPTSDYIASTDVNRYTNIAYATNSTDWFAQLQIGFLRSETGATLNLNRLLMFNDPAGPSNAIKYGTGYSYDRSGVATTTLASLTLPGFRPAAATTTNSLSTLANGNDLLLSSRPVQVISVNHGRWSNPGTWDTGEQPFPTDDVLVRHTVHGGFVRPIDNYINDENFHPGRSATSLANSIEIAAPAAGFLNPSLVWGNTGALNLFRTSPNAFVLNRAGTAAVTDNQAASSGNTNLYTGFVVFGGTTFRTANFYNNGAITNAGLIDVCNCD